jgi:hypothetical protein
MTARRRRIAWVAAGTLFVLGVLLSRAFWDGGRALRAGDAAIERRDAEEAIRLWRRAARWYVPGAPHVGAAYERLEALATAAAEGGDPAVALEAWRAVRSSILATRSFYTPREDLLARANQEIAGLMAREPGPAAAGATPEARRAWHLALLERDQSPSVAWTVIALAGFAAWVGGGFFFAWRGFTADDRLDRRIAARAGLVIALGLVVWMIGLYRA